MPRQSKPKALPAAPLRLDGFWLEKLQVSFADGAIGELRPDVALSGSTEVLATPADDFLVRLTISSDTSEASIAVYNFSLTLAGNFAVAEGTPDEAKKRLIHLNGPAILYGVARGVLASITGISAHGPIHLPSVNFIDLLEPPRRPPRKRTPKKAPAVAAKPD